MIASLIAGAALWGPGVHFASGNTVTVPFTFAAEMSPDSPLTGTKKTLFVGDWPRVVAIDAETGKRLWEANLISHAAGLYRANPGHSTKLGAFPLETEGSVAFCFTYARPDGTIETEIESRRRKDGTLSFVTHVQTAPASIAGLDEPVRPVYAMAYPNVAEVGNRLLIVPDPVFNPQLFVVSAATGAVQSQIWPGTKNQGPVAELLRKANPISFGASVYAEGELISLADSPYGPPSRLVYLGDRVLAQYLGESFARGTQVSEQHGIALYPWSPAKPGKVEDIWHGAFTWNGPLREKPPTYGPCLGEQDGCPLLLRTQYFSPSYSIVKIDEREHVTNAVPLDTFAIWQLAVGENGTFLAYGHATNDLYDLRGTKLLSLSTRAYFHAALLPCGVAWTNYSRIGTSNKFKFVGAIVSMRKKRIAK